MVKVAAWSKSLEPIFGGFSYLVSAIFKIAEDFEPFEYHFMPEQLYRDLMTRDPIEAQQVCCSEILQRAHIAAVTGLVRYDRWLKGVVAGYENDNLFVFSSSFRGFLESGADTHYALATAPGALANNAECWYECLNKIRMWDISQIQGFEDRLIHYSHGRDRRNVTEMDPSSHRARHMREYIEYFDFGSPAVRAFYGDLCEITHPAMDSVFCMLASDNGESFGLRRKFDHDAMNSLRKKNEQAIDWLFTQCIGPCLLTLGLINLMGIDRLKTDALRHVDLELIPNWTKRRHEITSVFVVH